VILRAAVLLALVGLVAGCALIPYVDEDAEQPKQAAKPVRKKARKKPKRVKVYVVAVDGDTGRRVRTAVARVGRERDRANRKGLSTLRVRRLAPLPVRVSAPGYLRRTVRVPFHRRRQNTVRIYRRSLQWPMYGVTPQRTQSHPRIRLRPPFRVVWSRGVGSLVEFPAVISEGVAYVSNQRGEIWAVEMRTGKVVWRRRTDAAMAASPAVVGDQVVVHGMRGNVWVLARSSGRVLWRYHVGSPIESSPVVRDGVDYFGAWNGTVYALDLERKRLRWTHRTGFKVTSSAAIAGNRLFIGDYAGRVFALNARTGRLLWTGSAGSRVYGTVAVARGRVYAPSVFSGMSALSARTGRLRWRVPVGDYLYSSPAVYRNSVYFGTYEGLVYRVSARSGRIIWTRSAGGGAVSGAVQVVAGLVYAATLRHRTTAWHWRTGRTRWSFRQGKYVPLSGNGERLLVHGATRIWAVEPKRKRR
jgi:outer membrane protein assembly factor BamB